MSPIRKRPFAALSAAVLALVAGVSLPASAAGGARKKASVKVVNRSEWSIHHLFLSPAEEIEWGPDQLGKEVIDTGESFTLTGIDCATWDVKVVDEDGDECVVQDVDLCREQAVWELTSAELLRCQASLPVAKSSSVTIVNGSSWSIHHFHLSPTTERSWGPDQLGREVIDVAERFTLTDIECDVYDIKLVDEDGDECVVEDVNLCAEQATWKISSKELLACQGFGG